MIAAFFHTFFYNPIYNALVAFVAIVPGSDVGIAIILLTIGIRIILLPFSVSAARTQRAMKDLQPKLKELKEKHKGNREQEAIETLALYREANVKPFASILTTFIQIPILLALYWVFIQESFPAIDMAKLYALTPVPDTFSLAFLGLIPVAEKSLLLAIFAGLTQFVLADLMIKGTMKPADDAKAHDFQKIMGLQLKYVFPFLIGAISYSTSAAIALYFIATNLAGAAQEWHLRRTFEKEALPQSA